ncbi:hypothetical protein SPW_7349 [Streptomyces sp. W007]|uniref:hypothetical protein n=1 Tax=Streptomyces sp. W007 TaxID=1055352 RepID=UPI000241A784|nr:hypothetical protein [Streptomyces sp. W007]EHM24255.1 hypothetical protein SPW_7349 [Streptomyces sp. W007]
MATNGSLNDMEQWRSVVEYQTRKSNPESTFQNRFDVPAYLEEWDEEIRTDTRGPYQSAGNARSQASRDAASRTKQVHGGWGPNPRMSTARVVRVYVERAALAWEPFDERNTETGKWGSS